MAAVDSRRLGSRERLHVRDRNRSAPRLPEGCSRNSVLRGAARIARVLHVATLQIEDERDGSVERGCGHLCLLWRCDWYGPARAVSVAEWVR